MWFFFGVCLLWVCYVRYGFRMGIRKKYIINPWKILSIFILCMLCYVCVIASSMDGTKIFIMKLKQYLVVCWCHLVWAHYKCIIWCILSNMTVAVPYDSICEHFFVQMSKFCLFFLLSIRHGKEILISYISVSWDDAWNYFSSFNFVMKIVIIDYYHHYLFSKFRTLLQRSCTTLSWVMFQIR